MVKYMCIAGSSNGRTAVFGTVNHGPNPCPAAIIPGVSSYYTSGVYFVTVRIFKSFWGFYQKNLVLATGVAAFLFALQLVHLYWLSAHVVAHKVLGKSFFELGGVWYWMILVVDYLEIPAILSTSLVYLNEVRQGKLKHGLLYLFFINSQWLHIFWITDEFVVEQFSGQALSILPFWLAWIALAIDYLELPVIYDTLKKFFVLLKGKQYKQALQQLSG